MYHYLLILKFNGTVVKTVGIDFELCACENIDLAADRYANSLAKEEVAKYVGQPGTPAIEAMLYKQIPMSAGWMSGV